MFGGEREKRQAHPATISLVPIYCVWKHSHPLEPVKVRYTSLGVS